MVDWKGVPLLVKFVKDHKCDCCKESFLPGQLEFAHARRRKTYSIGEIVRKKYDKEVYKKRAMKNCLKITFLLCRPCHRRYDEVRERCKEIVCYENIFISGLGDCDFPKW